MTLSTHRPASLFMFVVSIVRYNSVLCIMPACSDYLRCSFTLAGRTFGVAQLVGHVNNLGSGLSSDLLVMSLQ
jgi:hypothetical protein